MRITKISLKDFRVYESETVTLDQPLSLFRGLNHSGKTSLAQAIKLALSKCADGTDPRGAGALDKVRLGANKAIIETVIEGKQGLVTLTTQYGPGKTGRTQKIATTPESEKVAAGFDKYLDANQERLSCVLDSQYFVSQKPEAQKAILATLVLPTSYEFDPEMTALAEKHLGAFVWDKSPVAVIDQVYEAAYAGRRTAKAALGAIRIPTKPQQPECSAEEVQGKLTKLRAAAAKESKAVSGGGTVQIGRIEQSLEQEREKAAAANAELEKVVAQRDALDDLVPDPTTLKEIERRAAGRKLFDQIQAKINATDSEIRAQLEAQTIYGELLQDARGRTLDHANCPTCTQPITRAFIDGKIAEHKQLQAEATQGRMNLIDEQKALGDIDGAERELQAIAQRVKDAVALGRTIKQVQGEITASQSTIETLTTQLAQAKASVQAPADTAALDRINAELAKWEALLSPALNYNATLEQITRTHAQWVEQKDAVDDLEVLCTHFGKDGIKAELIAKHIGEFSETINGVLAAWGYSATLQIEPYEFIVTTATGNTLPLKELSGSEKLMFSVALQTAIAVHGKIKMVVVDEGDTFVGPERGRLLGCLKKLLDAGTLDQALVFASDIDKTKIAKTGVATFWIEAGRVSVL
jgi:DNA repair exonuclease SbcCD ATPase subunit